jgi:hypothetical protein
MFCKFIMLYEWLSIDFVGVTYIMVNINNSESIGTGIAIFCGKKYW